MRKIILSMMVSVDGYIEGANRDLYWHVWDEEMAEYMMGFFDTVDTFIYGRISYELMIDYWPSETGEFARIMNATPKLVFSRTLDQVKWNSKLIREFNPEDIMKLKQQPGKDLALFAGADIAKAFIQHGLVDEFRLIVNPVTLGEGTPLFKELKEQLKLRLKQSKTFQCGNVLLCYEQAGSD